MSSHSNVLTLIISLFSNDKNLIPFISATPKLCDLAGRGEVGTESPGCQCSATKNSLAVLSKLSVCWHVLFSLSWWAGPLLLAHVWWDAQSHPYGDARTTWCQADTPELPEFFLGRCLDWERPNKRKGEVSWPLPLPFPTQARLATISLSSLQAFANQAIKHVEQSLLPPSEAGKLCSVMLIKCWGWKALLKDNILINYYCSSECMEGKGCSGW